jgi:6-phosphofructokinase 1
MKIAILTSGGDAPGMNAAIRSITRYGISKGFKIMGIHRGYQGLIEEDFVNLNARSVSNIVSRGGTFLKTARSKDFFEKKEREKAYENLKNEKVTHLVVIGGNGSFNGALKFYKEFDFPVIGIPGTIDNDVYGTTRTIGFDTALNTALDAIDKIKDTATSMDRIFIVEVMGRLSGAIAVYSALASGAEDIVIPGEKCDFDEMKRKIDKGRKKGKKSWIIIVAEGAYKGEEVANMLRDFISDVRVTVIGHIQRGGSPSAFDRFLGAIMGKKSVDAIIENKNCHAVGYKNEAVYIYPLEEAAKNKGEDFSSLHDLIHILT